MAQEAASRIDQYVQHLLRHKAHGLWLESDQPVRFQFPQGDRASSSSLDHASVESLIQESAPPPALDQLSRTGRASFDYDGPNGARVQVSVEAKSEDRWKVSITPSAQDDDDLELDLSAPPAVLGGASPAAAAAAAMPPKVTLPSAPAPVGAPLPVSMPSPADVQWQVVPMSPGVSAPAQAASTPQAPPAAAPSPQPQPRKRTGPARIDRYLRRMIEMGASDLHICSGEVPFVRVDGEIRPMLKGHEKFEDAQVRELLYEVITPRAQQQFATKNDTDFAYAIEGAARFRVNYFLDRKGMGGVFRLIPCDIISPQLLGLSKAVLDLCWLSKGLVMVTGPTGCGKSTTLAALVDYINRHRCDHIVTIEDPIEFVHENKKCLVNQREVGTHTDSFKHALRATLREDPDIVLVGELRDLETIAMALETAETGHLVFGTLHTTSAAGTIDRIIDQFPPDQQSQIRTIMSESLRAVIAQVLCKKIGGGRIAAYEILIVNAAIANLIREAKTYQIPSIMQTGRTGGMQAMNDHLMDLVKSNKVDPKQAYVKSNDKQVFREMLDREGINVRLN